MAKQFENAEYKDEEEEESGDSDEEEEVLQQEPRPNAVYNSVALHEKLEDIGWPDGIDWMQTLCVDYPVEEGEIDVNDDLAREMAFYTQALEGTRDAFTKLLHSGTPFLRPPDYYAEMVKTDSHMLKVKDMLFSQQKQMEEAEERRKARDAKRFSKEVQAQKLKQRAQEKKHNIESVKKWRKMRQDQGFIGGEDEFPVDLDNDDDARGARGTKKRRRDAPIEGPSKKFKGNSSFDDGSPGKGTRNFSVDKGHKSKKLRFGSSEKDWKSDESAFSSAEKGSRSAGSQFGSGVKGRRISFGESGIRSQGVQGKSAPWDRSGGKGSSSKAGEGKAFQKRQSRDAKYGHGGRKGFKKANTAESSAGFTGLT